MGSALIILAVLLSIVTVFVTILGYLVGQEAISQTYNFAGSFQCGTFDNGTPRTCSQFSTFTDVQNSSINIFQVVPFILIIGTVFVWVLAVSVKREATGIRYGD